MTISPIKCIIKIILVNPAFAKKAIARISIIKDKPVKMNKRIVINLVLLPTNVKKAIIIQKRKYSPPIIKANIKKAIAAPNPAAAAAIASPRLLAL